MNVERVIGYIKHQKVHHCNEDLIPEWEETFVEVNPK
jgi:hypothetical protein